MVPIVDDAASLVVVIVITPADEIDACRLLAASAVLRSFNDLTVPPVPSPKVIEVAVPFPVAPIVSVKPPSAVVPPLRAVVPAVRPSFVSVPAVPPMTRSWAVPVLRVSLGSAERRGRGCAGDGVDGTEQVADRGGGQIEGRSRSRDDVTAGARECDGLAVDGEAVGGRDRGRQCAQFGGRRRSTAGSQFRSRCCW